MVINTTEIQVSTIKLVSTPRIPVTKIPAARTPQSISVILLLSILNTGVVTRGNLF